MLPIPIIIIGGVLLAVASWTDLKTLEVPDWLSYAGIAAGLGINALFSVQQWAWDPIFRSGLGFAAGFAVACLLFYTGQWGGADAKLLMAVGALAGVRFSTDTFLLSFLANLLAVGAIWGLLFMIGVAIKHRQKVFRTFLSLRNKKRYARLRIMSLLMAVFVLVAAYVYHEVGFGLVFALFVYFLTYLTIFVKSVELSGMHKWVKPEKLTEGDWIVHTISVNGKVVAKPGGVGLEKEQVNALKKLSKKIGHVCVRYGVPFVPAFFFAFLLTIYLGNFFIFVMRLV